MGKRTRSQRRGSSPKNRVSSHKFPAANRIPRVSEKMGEVTDLVHSAAHTPLLLVSSSMMEPLLILPHQKVFQ